MKIGPRWSERDTEIALRMHHAGSSDAEIARTVRRSIASVQGRILWVTMSDEQRQRRRDQVNANRRGEFTNAPTREKVPAEVLLDRERRETAPRSLSAVAFGDPAPGQSALDKRGGHA